MMQGVLRWVPCAVMSVAMGCDGDPVASKHEAAAIRFEPSAWRSANAEVRGRMCEDLLATRKLVGMPLDEVIELLGAPDSSNHYVWYWLGPTPDDPAESPGRFKIYFEDDTVISFDRDCMPGMELRPPAVPFDRERWLAGSGKERLAMLDGALALEPEFHGRPRAAVEDYFGTPSVHSHDVWYALGPEAGSGFTWSQRMLSLEIDTHGLVVCAVDRVARD